VHIARDLTELIGRTPLLQLGRLYDDARATVYAKLENFNPMSNKDRPVLHMIREAVANGRIGPDTEVVEASSGNTAIAIATLGAMQNFRVRIFMSEVVSIERRRALAAFGAKIVLTPGSEYTRGARDRAIAYCEANPQTALFLNQHGNPDNPRMHELTTGPELWEQLGGRIDAVVIALGTCGTFDGVTRYLKRMNPAIRAIGVEPAGSPLYSGGKQGTHHIYGMGPGLVTEIYQRSPNKPDEIILAEDEAAYEWTRRIAHREGMLVGLTSGAVAWAAGRVAARPEFESKNIVTFFYDTGERYLSIDGLYPDGDIQTVR
jgi:cysteine synthase A